jgi:hypothetical protein
VTRVVAGAVERAARAASGAGLPEQGAPLHDIGGHPHHRDVRPLQEPVL